MKYDDATWKKRHNLREPPIPFGDTEVETSVKVTIWAKSNRYVKDILGLNELFASAAKANKHYKYCLDFLKLTGKLEN